MDINVFTIERSNGAVTASETPLAVYNDIIPFSVGLTDSGNPNLTALGLGSLACALRLGNSEGMILAQCQEFSVVSGTKVGKFILSPDAQDQIFKSATGNVYVEFLLSEKTGPLLKYGVANQIDVSAAGGGPVDLNNAALTGATTAEQISPVPAPMGGLVIDVTKARNTKSVTADSTFTFSATPPAGAVFGLRLTGDGTPRAITIPSSYSTSQNATITGFTLPANGTVYLCWEYTGSGYNLTGEPLPPPRVQTNAQVASYELVLSDEGKVVEITSGSANDLSVPNNSDVPYPIGAQIIPRQGGTGQTTIVPLSGVTINSRDGALKLAGRYASAVLTKKATNTWNLDGDIVT